MVVIDGNELVMGRACSEIAKILSKGAKVDLINSEKIIILGTKKDIFAKYTVRRNMKGKGNPEIGPKFPRTTQGIFKRSLRGMLPKTARGREMLKKFKAYTGIPKEFEGKEKKELMHSKANSLHKFITLKELSSLLGAKQYE
ncbi:MAG: 50S ribosomal protein L13 [Candidatus Diapherotrites archaeon]|nr:50S ribosomal protein L13 [Candidatus Diapherotrites archaeon]